nr:MAG TPA: hypothetical protein [Caudoviricetes sp.]
MRLILFYSFFKILPFSQLFFIFSIKKRVVSI